MRAQLARHGLGVARKPRRKRTTFPVPVDAPNLRFAPGACGELLVSDFTYVPLRRGFGYFAVTIDVFSRRVRGWSFSRSMAAGLVLDALAQALACGELGPGWVHHSDRGAQYAGRAFRELVERHRGTVSFSAAASPQDNAYAESFFARFKDEAVRTCDEMDFDQARELARDFVEHYNLRRPHSSLGYRSPVEFEEACAAGPSLPESVS
jgi:transposase InsO family protein